MKIPDGGVSNSMQNLYFPENYIDDYVADLETNVRYISLLNLQIQKYLHFQ